MNTLLGGFPAGGPQPPILPPVDGFLFLDRDTFYVSRPAAVADLIEQATAATAAAKETATVA